MKPEARVQWVYASSNIDELAKRYDQWSTEYDGDLAEKFGWIAPQRAADSFSRHVPKNARILDAGVGTGLVGACLEELGYRDLTGIDLSPGMLEEAAKKGVYRDLRPMVLGEPLDLPTGAFDAVICVGVFTLGHAPPHALRELVRIVKSGGHIVLGMRPDVHEDPVFKEVFAGLESEGLWTLVEVGPRFQPLPTGEPEVEHRVWVYKITQREDFIDRR
jgi:SAM-dependent methyltransferase